MRLVRTHSLIAASLIAAGFGATAAQAQQVRPVGAAMGAASPSSLRESIRRVERETGGEVLQARPTPWNGREVNRVKVLTPEGRVRVVTDDPRQASAERERRRRDSRSRDDGR
ncbi:hypothetical protein [Coralloluteibacterium stylophorae]|uniref:PepSY domain-containing protein n=1 Tax=Coralloluteibacterium stylophorae TaxID=1776034 RepID=A0AAP2CF84_9GAMM|nr:hypothetical protein [Coralloluteibacterium stylophorae]MBS7458212.1 hypothetical protein [Coralloluteibacterium stylophorae]